MLNFTFKKTLTKLRFRQPNNYLSDRSRYDVILLMVQKSHSQPPGMVQKPYVNNWKKLPYQLVMAGFLPSSTVCKSMMLYTHYTHKSHPEVEKVDLLDEFTHPKTGRKRGAWGLG